MSAALAGVLERATSKELENRYRSMAEFLGDLEEVLTYETARAGESTGEATAILSALPADVARQRPAWRRFAPLAAYVLIAAVAAVAAVVLIGSDGNELEWLRHERPVADPAERERGPRLRPPPGDGSENTEQKGLALDGDKTTAWETENYDTPDLGNIKDGVGLYLDAGRPVVAHAIRIVTPKSGWAFKLYVANQLPAALSGWTLVGGGSMDSTRKTVKFNAAGRTARATI